MKETKARPLQFQIHTQVLELGQTLGL